MATSRRQFLRGSAAAGVATLVVGVPRTAAETEIAAIRSHPEAFVVALVGDFGSGRPAQRAVSQRLHSWKPRAVFTMGDNVYGEAGDDPKRLLKDRVTAHYGKFVSNKSFYPALGNHDWGETGPGIIEQDGQGGTHGVWHDTFDYLPGNGRYYDVRIGPLHVFVLHDYFREPDGHRLGDRQSQWLETAARASNAPYKMVVHHYAPYVSSPHANKRMRWPYGQWGIHTSFTGHWHHYERRSIDGVTYVVNGAGGARPEFVGPREANVDALYAERNGACRMTVAPEAALIEFVSDDGVVRDSFVQRFSDLQDPVNGERPAGQPQPPLAPGNDGPLASEPFVSSTGRAAVIARLYFAVFERAPDLPGFDYWTSLGLPVTDVAELFVSSAEFLGRYGHLSNSEFVDRVYRNVLGRQADSEGFQYWVGVLDAGNSRGDLMIGFSESVEFRRRSGIRN